MRFIKTIILITAISLAVGNLTAAELPPKIKIKKHKILKTFKEEVQKEINTYFYTLYHKSKDSIHKFDPTILLSILQKYTTTYPEMVQKFVSTDFLSGDYSPLPILSVIVIKRDDIFLDVIRYLVEKMHANVNAWTIRVGSWTALNFCHPNSKIYKYLISKEAKFGSDYKIIRENEIKKMFAHMDQLTSSENASEGFGKKQ